MVTQDKIKSILGDLQTTANAGYALAFHLQYTTPTYLFQTYASEWLDYYGQNSLLMRDPTILWGFENNGHIRWSELKAADSAGVLDKAAEFGMNYGASTAVEVEGKRSLGGFSRSDREFTDAELTDLVAAVEQLHNLLDEVENLSPETAAELRKMSVLVTHP